MSENSKTPNNNGDKPAHKPNPIKNMTKQERRELQERNRLEKAAKKTDSKKHQQQSSSSSSPPTTQSSVVIEKQFSSTDLSISSPQSSSSHSQRSTLRKPPSNMRYDDPKIVKKMEKSIGVQRLLVKKPNALFSHLNQFQRPEAMLIQITGVVHPSVIALGLQFSEFIIAGGNARCIAMLNVFKRVIHDYITPPGLSLQRHLSTYLGKQIDFLTSCRVLAASMKSAIRRLKHDISVLSIDKTDSEAKEILYSKINDFIHTKITVADQQIVTLALENINHDDVILTHSRSSVVLGILQAAFNKGIKFRVIVCDSRPKLEGKELLKRLVATGIPCTYIMSNALGVVMKEVSKVVIGASALFSNGAVMNRSGTAVVSMMAYEFQVPVIVCCESFKFSDSVRLDSFVWNEIGDPDELVDTSNREPSSRLPTVVPNPSKVDQKFLLEGWRDIEALGLLNLHYDVTPAHLITMVICEIGIIAPSNVVTVLRDHLEREKENSEQ